MEKEKAKKVLKYFQPWRELYKEAKDWDYGDFFSHEEISLVLDLSPGSKYYAQISRCNKELQAKRQRFLLNVPSQGYRVIMPNEHIGVSADIVQQSFKKYQKGLQVAHSTNTSKLTVDEATKLADYIVHAEGFRMAMQKNKKELAAIAGRNLLNAKNDSPGLEGGSRKRK
jgi:hypothetical protein